MESEKGTTMATQRKTARGERLVSRPNSGTRIKLDPDQRRRLEEDVESGAVHKAAGKLLTTTDSRQVALDRVRKAQKLTQVELAHKLGSTQARVSGMESRPDLRVSTIRSYVEAAGGELEIVAVVNGERINIDAQ